MTRTWPEVLAPRLTYRLKHGAWCDHTDRQYLPLVDGHESVTWPGWSEWRMGDLGMWKYRACLRCGLYETTLGHPFRDWLADTYRRLRDHRARGHHVTAVALLLVGVALVALGVGSALGAIVFAVAAGLAFAVGTCR